MEASITSYLPQVVTLILGIGAVWLFVSKLHKLVIEIDDLLKALIVALADKAITTEELNQIIKEASDIPKAFKSLFSKSDNK